MEKDQPDSLATVAVGSEKISPASHYAPSEVYSTTEPPPAYMRPGKTTAVQIARIAAITLISMTVLLGSFILAASWIQARASCTPEAIAAMQASLHLQKLHEKNFNSQHQGEYLKHLQPAALVQNAIDPKNILQSLSESSVSEKEAAPEVKGTRAQRQNENNSKNDNENGDQDNDDDDYDDDEFPPVHIKLPLQLDLDDIAGSLIQQARSRVSCVVERRRADEVMDGADNTIDNSTDPQRFQRVSGERVSILCEAGNPQQEQQDQEMMTPIIVPLGSVQIPVQPQEQQHPYHQYQLHTQYQVPDMQQLPLSDPRGFNHIPAGVLPPELRNLPQLNMEMKPPRMSPPSQSLDHQEPVVEQIEMRQIPIELRHFSFRGMRPMRQEEPRPEHVIAMNFQSPMYQQNEQSGSMVPPPVPPQEQQMPEHRMNPQMMPPQPDQRPPQLPQEKPRSPLHGIPLEIRRIVQQVPMEIKNIIQHIMGDTKLFPVQVPEEARQEPKEQEFKPFPEGARTISLGPFSLPIQIKNLLERGSMEDRSRDSESNEQQQEAKPFPGPEDQGEEIERNFPIPAEVRRIIHQVVEGRAMPVPRISLPLRAVESIDIPVQARAEVTDNMGPGQHDEQHNHEQQEQHRQEHPLLQVQSQEKVQQEENRPHYVQPRSVRSIPDSLIPHRREKRTRRSCACDCNCPHNP